ncbi:MAG: OmpA family protein [Nitrospiraceae bacterium]
MSRSKLCFIIAGILVLPGCVSTGTHKTTVAELEASRKASAEASAVFEAYKKKTTAELEGLKEENTRLSNELLAAQTKVGQQQEKLDLVAKNLDATMASERTLETETANLRREASQATRLNDELRRERDILETKTSEREKQLEADAARDKELDQRLQATTEELGQLKQQAADRVALAARAKELDQRLQATTQELGQLKQQAADREALLAKTMAMAKEQERLGIKLEDVNAERARLEKERADKEAELQRLQKTQEDLSKSLQAEIAKGDIKIKQIRDRLTINMVEKVLFDSGKAEVKPAGLNVLQQVGDVLKKVTDKQIRIEGHTDNVPITGRLKQKFATNWELSTARATSVVGLLIDKGGVGPANLAAVGYADTRPVDSNDTPEGRSANRRIDIVLYPKDLAEIASEQK